MHLDISGMGMKLRHLTLRSLFWLLPKNHYFWQWLYFHSQVENCLFFFLNTRVFLSYSLLMILTTCVQDPASINADPETSGSSEWGHHKRKYISETIEHGSLSVISAKFEVSV
jgi:hypothetical protein